MIEAPQVPPEPTAAKTMIFPFVPMILTFLAICFIELQKPQKRVNCQNHAFRPMVPLRHAMISKFNKDMIIPAPGK